MDLLYPAATVLLDLTANEEKVEEMVNLMIGKKIFEYIIYDKLMYMINKNAIIKDTQLKKLRDLFIGMVLNLACNVEDQSLITYFVINLDILEPLLLILKDPRNDWPTHGASQALMQYAHYAM